MYGKIFEQMYDGTLSADWKAMIVFQQFIVLADSEGIVDYTPPALSRRTGIPLDIIEHGIEKLQEPDPYSRSKEFSGKRIALLDDHRPWGWSIVNYEYYRDLASREDQRIKARERKRKQRENQSQTVDSQDVSQDVTSGHASSRMSRHEDEDANEDADESTTAPTVPKEPPEFEEFKKAFPLRSGAQPWTKALRTIRARLKEGAQWSDFLEGAHRYAAYCAATDRIGTEYVMQAATFCGPDKHYLELWEPPATKSERRQGKNIAAGQAYLDSANGQ